MVDLPFSTEQFLGIFESYNVAIWPVQIASYLFGAVVVILAIWETRVSDKFINSILGVFWLWTGLVYHIIFFTKINSAAIGFGSLFIIQGLIFLGMGIFTDKLQYRYKTNAYGIIGLILVLYAMIIYPIIGSWLGHSYPNSPMFGVTPCPVTIFTFGLLLWTKNRRVYGWLLIIPGLWSVIGFTAAVKLGIVEDTGLLISGILGVGMLLYRNSKIKRGKLKKAV